MEATTLHQVQHWAEELAALHARIAARFARAEPRARALAYLQGLLSPVERKNGWQLAEQAGERNPYGMQRLLKGSHWNADEVRDDLRAYVMEQLTEEDAVLVVDETGFLKGEHSVGVKRQYSGTAGGIENCQVGVFLAYTSTRGPAFIDRELFLPKEWAQDQQRREKAQVPDERVFASKPQLAHVMLERALDAGVTAAWVTADSVYAASPLRRMLEAKQQAYVIAITSSFLLHFFEEEGLRQAKVTELFNELPAEAWQRLSAGQGSKGERLFDWAWLRLWDLGERSPELKRPHQEIGFDKWLLARRGIEDPSDLTFYIVFAPEDVTLEVLVRVAGTRWSVESGFEALKQEAGLDEYETRSWVGWYRHMTLSLLAHAFLTVVRAKQAQKGALLASSV